MTWKGLVAAVAPTIGTALGGPLGGMAANVLCSALGLPEGSKGDEIEKQLAGNPEQLLKVKEAEIAFKQRLAELNIDLEKVHQEDRSSARAREMSLKDRVPGLLALAVTCGFFGVLGWMLAYGIPLTGGEALLVMLGSLGSAWAGVISYYFGSSAGSDKKSELLAGR